MKKIFKFLYMIYFKICWRSLNRHNETTVSTHFNLHNVCVGKHTYGSIRIMHYNKNAKLKIGHYCSIADNVTFLLGGEHDYKKITTYPFNSKVYHTKDYKSSFETGGGGYDITVKDDVWIGYGTIILSGVTIGTGSIIGAGSVVAKDVPSYSVFVGNKVIKNRFSKEIVEKIKGIDWESISHKQSDDYEKYVNTKVTESNIDEILESFLN